MDCNTLIVGGGLSGLHVASLLHERGDDFQLIEARERLGGRILSQSHNGAQFDLGPAWFWPGQPRIEALIERLGLSRFEQYAVGDLTYEDETGAVQRGLGYSSMEGSYRLQGGLVDLIDAIASHLPRDRMHLACPASHLRQTQTGIEVTCADRTVNAKHVVMTTPPRVTAQLSFEPELPGNTLYSMRKTPTWMAGQAKAVALYDRPFWRDAGLSGDAMSRHGPMVEIHDASPNQGGPYALFGFIGIPPSSRQDEPALRGAIIAQFARLFGAEAGSPLELFLKDWAFDPFTATVLDHQPLHQHPAYGKPASMTGLWNNTLHFAGTETATQFGGFLEGALESAETVIEWI